MQARNETLHALTFVLIEKIYRQKPSLMRNDSSTASIVVKYVKVMLEEANSSDWDSSRNALFQREAQAVSYKISPLEHLNESTVRKYIAELWRSQEFIAYINFEKVKDYTW
jgi:hypothetical protein